MAGMWDDTKTVVDPTSIAIPRFRPMGVLVPDVVRPVLLTDQLRGCSCAPSSLAGLGQLGQDPETDIQVVIGAVQEAKSLWDQFLAVFGIHAGQREADVITPVQNAIT